MWYPAAIPTPTAAKRAKRYINTGGAAWYIDVNVRTNAGEVRRDCVMVWASCPFEASAKLHDAIKVCNDAFYRHHGPNVAHLISAYEMVGFPYRTRSEAIESTPA